jgi:antibiotic biosynthesis monooxygenase (ABM) superfamily enzyme
MSSPPDPHAPVTVVVRRRIRPDAHEAFDAWMDGIIGVASTFQGHIGANIIRPSSPASDQDHVLIFSFDSPKTLAAWLKKAEPLIQGEISVQKVSGLEYWFQLPGSAARSPPPRWKMAVVTIVALYPLIRFLSPQLAKVFSFLPEALVPLASLAVMVSLMTWAVMPTLTRLLARWLFPAKA